MARPHNLFSLLVCVTLAVTNVCGKIPDLSFSLNPVFLSEDPTVQTKLSKLVCTTYGGDTVDSYKLKSVNPAGPFSVLENPVGEFWVVYDATQDLNYASKDFYEATVTCTDSGNQVSNIASLFIYVTPNSPPTITGYPSSSITLSPDTFDYTTDTVFTVVATDPESDTLTYSLSSQQPNTGLFSINSATGDITANKDFKLLSISSYVLSVEVSDAKNTVSDFCIDVTIDNSNVAPVIRNLPNSINIAENSPSGTTLIKLSVEDDTVYGSPLKTTCSTSPASEAYKFTLNADNTITLSANNLLNYEVRSVYTISCTATDGYFSSDGMDVLTVNVQNVNESPYFNSNQYYCTLLEGATRDHYCSLAFTVTDPEGEAVSDVDFLASADSGNFYFDGTTKRVYLNVDYDLDTKVLATSLSLTLQAKDSGGATATATVVITVKDDNDNTCVFDKSIMYHQVDQSTALGLLGAFTVTDADMTSPNKDTNVEMVSSTPADASSYFTLSNTGQFYYTGAISPAKSGMSYIMVVKCKDLGSNSKSAFATVVISYTYITTTSTTPTTSTTSTPEKSLWDFDWFVAVFSICIALVTLLLIAGLTYLIYKCCCRPKPDTVSRSKVSPDSGEKRENRLDDYDDDDEYITSARSNFRSGRTWQNSQIPPRQIPALKYR